MHDNFKAMEEVILVIGNSGGDAGYTVITKHGVVHVPGNNPMAREAYAAIAKNYAILQEAAVKHNELGQAGAVGREEQARM